MQSPSRSCYLSPSPVAAPGRSISMSSAPSLGLGGISPIWRHKIIHELIIIVRNLSFNFAKLTVTFMTSTGKSKLLFPCCLKFNHERSKFLISLESNKILVAVAGKISSISENDSGECNSNFWRIFASHHSAGLCRVKS